MHLKGDGEKSLHQTDQAQFKFLPTNSRGPSMECANNTSCPLFIHSLTFLADYFTSSVLASNYTTSCLSSYLAEWKNRKNKKRTCTNCSYRIYLPTDICVHKLCLPRWTVQLLSMANPYTCKSHACPPQDDISPVILPSFSCIYFVSLLGCFYQYTNLLYPPSSYFSPTLKNSHTIH